MAKYNWQPLREMDLEDGTPTCYWAEDDEWFLYCTQIADNTWDCEVLCKDTKFYVTHANCKTLTSAKRWFARYW